MKGSVRFPADPVWLTRATTGRDDWLAARNTGIGGSDLAGIIGTSPFTTPYQVWADKTGRAHPEPDNERMRWGRLLEDTVAKEWAAHAGVTVRKVGMVADRHHPHRVASLDRVVIAPGTLTATDIVEVKTTSSRAADLADTELADRYLLQATWYLGITGLHHAWLPVLVGGQHLRTLHITFDDTLYAALCADADRFWADHVLTDQPPPVEPADNTAMSTHLPAEPSAPPVDLPEHLVEQLHTIRAEQDRLTTDRDRVEAQIKELLGPAVEGWYGNHPAVTWKPSTTTRWDVKRLAADHPELAGDYRTTTTRRRFLLKPLPDDTAHPDDERDAL